MKHTKQEFEALKYLIKMHGHYPANTMEDMEEATRQYPGRYRSILRGLLNLTHALRANLTHALRRNK